MSRGARTVVGRAVAVPEGSATNKVGKEEEGPQHMAAAPVGVEERTVSATREPGGGQPQASDTWFAICRSHTSIRSRMMRTAPAGASVWASIHS